MKARMTNPATVLDATPAIMNLYKAIHSSGAPALTLELVHLRVSQINGCAPCVLSGFQTAKKAGETDERLATVSVWREAPFFTDAERAALALAESAARQADTGDCVPDPVWDDAADHFDEKQLAGIITMIGLTKLFNTLNATTRQIAGAAW
ncbi:carboxymuconolactone decarboxylase family protein [Streptomyces goshikiensis]|uniref:carboxymuconolactone decarboxylase family protein n=1 Tax=Streptomyces goshikiensis TaxID=1942 RepID=UPI003717E784